MGVEGFVGPGSESGIGAGLRAIVADVRAVGTNVFEARDSEGFFSAIGYTAEGAIEALRTRLPEDCRLWRVWYPGARTSTELS